MSPQLSVAGHPGEERAGSEALAYLRPRLECFLRSPLKAAIFFVLYHSKHSGHCMSVEHMSRRLGRRHSIIIYHLEALKEMGLAKVVIEKRHGNSSRRSVWGLRMDNKELVNLVRDYVFSAYSREKLWEMTTRNLRMR